jgi:hypothetical protein
MTARLIDKNQAIELRKQGLTYSEIQKSIPVTKGVLSYWFKGVTFSNEEQAKLHSHVSDRRSSGRSKSISTNRNKRLNREIVAFEDAKKFFAEMQSDPSFLIGIALYWAEGAKKHNAFQFVNSDPDMIVFMFNWIQKYLKINQESIKLRLFIHKIPGYENIEVFWAGKLGLQTNVFQKTIYNQTGDYLNKNSDYKGCVRLYITNVYVFRLMKAWQKLLIQYHGDMRP